MKTDRQRLGKRGEDEACGFLMRNGHTVLERNWRHGHLEIDIITMSAGSLHFVEVKSRTAPASADPQTAVGYAKQLRLANAARAYLNGRGRGLPGGLEVFFDIVAVLYEGDKATIEYYPQAFIPYHV